MKPEEIIAGNKLIADFVGFEEVNIGQFDKYRIPEDFRKFLHCSHCQYLNFDNSWDWLMPVVEKIENIQLPCPSMVKVIVKIAGTSCRIYKGEWNDDKEGFISVVDYDKVFTKIKSTYLAVIEFIKWYNKNVPQNKK